MDYKENFKYYFMHAISEFGSKKQACSRNVYVMTLYLVEYGPVTMIVPASGHQVRCIPWVQMGTFNKEIGFLRGLKFFALNISSGNTYNRVYIWCCKYGENRYCERCADK